MRGFGGVSRRDVTVRVMMNETNPQYALDRPLLTVTEVGNVLRIGRTSVYRLVAEGALHPVKVRDRLRFRVEDLEQYLELDRETAP